MMRLIKSFCPALISSSAAWRLLAGCSYDELSVLISPSLLEDSRRNSRIEAESASEKPPWWAAPFLQEPSSSLSKAPPFLGAYRFACMRFYCFTEPE